MSGEIEEHKISLSGATMVRLSWLEYIIDVDGVKRGGRITGDGAVEINNPTDLIALAESYVREIHSWRDGIRARGYEETQSSRARFVEVGWCVLFARIATLEAALREAGVAVPGETPVNDR